MIFLQETHCSDDRDSYKWTKEWSGHAIWSHGENNSKGVAILVKNNIGLKLTEVQSDGNGRYIIAKLSHDELGKSWTLCNVYAPNAENDRKAFFERISSALPANDDICLGGDFNCTLNVNLDRKAKRNVDDAGSKEVKSLMNTFDLEDIWRRRNPTKKAFTFHGGAGKSRIDLWLISKSLDSAVENCDIVENPLSGKDHSGITLILNLEQVSRGPGVWKMNNSVIESTLFKETFEQFWASWKGQTVNYSDIKTWWEIGKMKIKELTIWAATKLNKNEAYIKSLEQKLANLTDSATTDSDEIENMRTEIREYYSKKAEAARIRARENWFEKGEKSTAYFFGLERKRACSKTWTKIKISENHYESGIGKILEKQSSFYEELFTSQGCDRTSFRQLLSAVEAKLGPTDKIMLDEPLTNDELRKSLNMMANNKSPGDDGISAEFYKKYWYLIGDDFTKLTEDIFKSGSLCKSQYSGLITLLYKAGEREDIANWRPITLLNTDYKIIAKTLAERLKTVLPKIINPDQKGFVKGRKIEEGARLIQDIITYTEKEDLGGAIIFLDQKKAFDRVEHEWIWAVLEKFGFGRNFIEWMKILYSQAESSILTNGFRSRKIKITRSVRQGCPVAPLLYVLQAEPFAESIRKNENIKGIRIPGDEAKIGMFADDTDLFISTKPSFDEVFRTLGIYERVSGAAVNWHKTKGMLLGTWRNKPPPTDKLKWENRIKALGIIHGFGIDEKQLWKTKFDRIRKNLTAWKHRDLTYEGKVLLIKSLGISIVGYEIRIKGIDPVYLKELKSILFSFLWNNKQPLVNRNTVTQPKNKGGLNMLDVDNYVKVMQIKWINEIITSPKQRWNTLAKYWLGQFDIINDTNPPLLSTCSCLKNFDLRKIPEFYRSAIKTWSDFIKERRIYDAKDILEENLFNNEHILHRNKPIHFKRWIESGVTKVKHIWNTETKAWKLSETIRDSLRDKSNWMAETLAIKNSIPTEWKNILAGNEDNTNGTTTSDLLTVENSTWLINGKNIRKATNKEMYSILQQNYPIPRCEQLWNEKLNKNLNWPKIWQNLVKNKIDRKIKQFLWKCLYEVNNTGERLRKMGKGNGKCQLCNKEEETQNHLFLNCEKLYEMPGRLTSLIAINLNIQTVNLNEELLLAGFCNDFSPKQNAELLKIIGTYKWNTWKRRNTFIFENKLESINTLYRKIENLCQ